MTTSALPTTATAMPPLPVAPPDQPAARVDSTTRSISSAKSSAAGAVEGGFSSNFSVGEAAAIALTVRDASAVPTCATTFRSSFEEAASGCEKEIEITKLDACQKCDGTGAESGARASSCPTCGGRGQVISSRGFFQVAQTCPRCRGTGQIIDNPCGSCSGEGRVEAKSRIKLKIPAGIEDGSRLRSSRNGEAGIRGGAPGDLYVVIHVKEHNIFQREEDNLYCEVPVSFVAATLGGEIRVPTLEGKASLKIPAGTQSGTTFKLRSKGMPVLNSSAVGDLMVTVLVEVPTKLNAEQRKKLEEFAELCGDDNTPIHKSFFEKAKELFQ
ncbi:MAG: DnaJ C-terminal domain-containing protein [Chthoniobacteraceae bacterium]